MRLNPTNISIIKRLLQGRNSKPLRGILQRLNSVDMASLLGSVGQREKRLLLEVLLSMGEAAEALMEMPEEPLVLLLAKLDMPLLKRLISESPAEQAAYFVSLLKIEPRTHFLEQLDEGLRSHLLQILNYPENSAGRIMHTHFFALPRTLTANEAIDRLRANAQEMSIHYVYCIDTERRLCGVLSLRTLAIAPASKPLEELMKEDVISVAADTPEEDVAKLVSHYDFIALPVTDDQRHLIGIITVDDVVDIIQDQVTADLYARAGLPEDDRIFTSGSKSFRNRLPWMVLNLFLAGLASSVVSFFETTMSQLIVLASLKNIVAGIGGNTAIQTLTVVTRGLATGDFNFITERKVLFKEVSVGVSLGLLTGVLAAVLVYLWKGSLLVAGVICLSMVLNSLVASLVGVVIPLFLNRLKWDPAVGSGVLVTVVTDIFGFFSFLGIASLGLKFFGYL